MSARDDMRRAVDQAVESVLAKLRADLVDRVVTGLPEPPPPPPPPAPVAAAGGPDLGKLRNEVFTLMDGTGQVEILNRLMESIGHWWGRSVLFLVKGTAFQPWDARGFESQGGNAAIKAIAINEGTDTILDAALSGTGSQAGNSQLEQRLGPHQGVRAAVPLGIRNKAAAILYVDSPKVDDEAAVAALETVARIGAAAIELGMLTKRTPPFVRTEAVRAPAASAKREEAPMATGFAMREPEPEIVAEPEVEIEVEATPAPPPPAFKAPSPAPTFTPPPAPVPTFTPPPAPAPTFAPPPAAAPAFAPPPAAAPTFTPPPTPAPAPAAAPPAAAAPPPASALPTTAAGPTGAIEGGALDPRELLKGGAKPVVDAGQTLGGTKSFSRWKPVRDQVKSDEVDPALAAVPEGERSKHVDARKIARLLVSEIKLYNEAKVAVGRKNKDLYERLKDDIERSRQTYNERIDAEVAKKTNYFRDELVATLGEGDASALGPGLR